MIDKELVKKRFGRNLESYNQNADIQRKMANKLISLINTTNFQNILEIGCGTGFLTEIINQKLEFENYMANDIVPECKTLIEQINPNITFIEGDIEKLVQYGEKKFDLIISNASLQWVENFQDTISKLTERLTKNGIFLFSTFGAENYREIYFTMGQKLNYYSLNDLKTILQIYKPYIEEEIHIKRFKTPKDVLKHLHSTGVNALKSTAWTKKDLKEFENTYNNLCSNNPTLTYNPIYIKIQQN